MASTGYDYGVRSGLNQKGIANDRITYNPNSGVMVDGQSFMKPDKVYQGTSYTSSGNFNSAWDNYNKANQKSVGSASPGVNSVQGGSPYGATGGGSANAGYDPYANVKQNPYTNQTDQIIQQLLNFSQNQQPFDPYGSSQYQAAQAQAGRAAQQNTRAAQEAYGSAGFGRSSAMGERIAGVQNDATEYLMTQVLPQIEAQEQARRQQEFGNMMSALNPLMSQQGRADNQVQQGFDNRVTEGQLTGNYVNEEAAQLISQIMDLKGQAEVKGLPNTDVKALSAQADQYRNRLAELGYDPSLFGSNLNAEQAGGNRGVATRTLQGQQLDHNKATDQRNFDYGVERDARGDFVADRGFDEGVRQYNTTLEYTQGRDATKDAQWQQEFDRILKQDGIQNALAWAQNSISQQNANTSAYSASTSRMNADNSRLMDIWQATGVAPEGIPNVAAGTPYGSELDRNYRQAQVDQMGAKVDSAKPSKNEIEAELYTNIDRLQAQGYDLRKFFKSEQNNIIRDIGKSGFDALKQSYRIYD